VLADRGGCRGDVVHGCPVPLGARTVPGAPPRDQGSSPRAHRGQISRLTIFLFCSKRRRPRIGSAVRACRVRRRSLEKFSDEVGARAAHSPAHAIAAMSRTCPLDARFCPRNGSECLRMPTFGYIDHPPPPTGTSQVRRGGPARPNSAAPKRRQLPCPMHPKAH